MPLDLPQGHFANEQPAPYVRGFHDPRYGDKQHSDNRDGRNVRNNEKPWQDHQSVPTSAPSAPAPFVGSSAMDFPVAAAVERVMDFERPQSENGSLRYGSYVPTSSVSVAKPSAEESDALKTEALKLVQDLQVLIEDLDIDADKLASERRKVEVRVAEIEAGSKNLRVFVETRIRPFLLMLEKKQNLIVYCEELNATNESLTAVEAELANDELQGKERDGVKAKRSGLRKNQRRLDDVVENLRRSSRALDKFAESLLEGTFADAKDAKLHRMETFYRSKDKKRALKKRRGLEQQVRAAATGHFAERTMELLKRINHHAMNVFGSENLRPGRSKKRGFHAARQGKRALQDDILRENFSYKDEGELQEQSPDSEIDVYETEYRAEIDEDKNIEYLQTLTRTRAKRAQDLVDERDRYYTESYPDIEGRELRERERREADYALREDARKVPPEAFAKLVNSDPDFADLSCHFRRLLAEGYEKVDSEFAARRQQELQAAWAKLEGAEEDGDEALAA